MFVRLRLLVDIEQLTSQLRRRCRVDPAVRRCFPQPPSTRRPRPHRASASSAPSRAATYAADRPSRTCGPVHHPFRRCHGDGASPPATYGRRRRARRRVDRPLEAKAPGPQQAQPPAELQGQQETGPGVPEGPRRECRHECLRLLTAIECHSRVANSLSSRSRHGPRCRIISVQAMLPCLLRLTNGSLQRIPLTPSRFGRAPSRSASADFPCSTRARTRS